MAKELTAITGVAASLGSALIWRVASALRGYDSCTSGDERFTAANFFKKLDAMGPNAKASDIFKSGAFDPGGAKK
jgi:hypothetical protein